MNLAQPSKSMAYKGQVCHAYGPGILLTAYGCQSEPTFDMHCPSFAMLTHLFWKRFLSCVVAVANGNVPLMPANPYSGKPKPRELVPTYHVDGPAAPSSKKKLSKYHHPRERRSSGRRTGSVDIIIHRHPARTGPLASELWSNHATDATDLPASTLPSCSFMPAPA
jgi:hypothetical protein